MLDLGREMLIIPAELAKNRREYWVALNPTEAELLREQLSARAGGTNLVFPTATGKRWTANRFGERVWTPAVEAAAVNNKRRTGQRSSVFDGFTFHLLRHTGGLADGACRHGSGSRGGAHGPYGWSASSSARIAT